MKEFFAENWKFIVYIVIALLGIVITILKKTKLINKTIDTPFERVISLLPGLISAAEKSELSGDKKKVLVISNALALLDKFLDRELSDEERYSYIEKIGFAIESILETPQKKGIIYDEKKEN